MGEKLKSLRIEKKLTQKQVSERIELAEDDDRSFSQYINMVLKEHINKLVSKNEYIQQLKKSNDITIPKYTGKIEFKYGKSVK